MQRILTAVLILFIFTNLVYSQISEKIELIVAGGTSFPVESFIVNPFEFPQLNDIVGVDFAQVILDLEKSSSNFEEYWSNGFNIGAGLEYKLNEYFSVRAGFTYNNFIFDKNRLEKDFASAFADTSLIGLPFNSSSFDLNRGSTDIYTISLNIKAKFPLAFVSPYVTVGGGYLRIQQESLDLTYFDAPSSQDPITISFFDRIPSVSNNAFMGNIGGGLIFNLASNIKPFVEGSYILGRTDGDDTIIYPIKFGFIFSFK